MQIDLSSIETEEQLHTLLSSVLSFPVFYGQNWDAFWDSITGLVELPENIEFTGSQSLRLALPSSYQQLQSCFADLKNEYPNINCSVVWN
ncbi:barstar family protein [Vibrio parahaemolyticus]|uniref:Ribonuclease inhibitor n=1 Tax=Vibrio parahaemolyticus TaxID=670 RepID=A0AA46QSB5_VIBPH|nr:barstar family protein [Vibrio parahaemolyticus]EID4334207.1 barstar family protein [Vibrio parahaemolyticus]TXN13600.1 ribonuclease inhibitor [Vibrio parahaemolyticus]